MAVILDFSFLLLISFLFISVFLFFFFLFLIFFFSRFFASDTWVGVLGLFCFLHLFAIHTFFLYLTS